MGYRTNAGHNSSLQRGEFQPEPSCHESAYVIKRCRRMWKLALWRWGRSLRPWTSWMLNRTDHILQSSIPKPRGAWKFAYSRMITNRSVHVIITTLTATIVGARVWGSMRLGLRPEGGWSTELSVKLVWCWVSIVAVPRGFAPIRSADSHLGAKTWLVRCHTVDTRLKLNSFPLFFPILTQAKRKKTTQKRIR